MRALLILAMALAAAPLAAQPVASPPAPRPIEAFAKLPFIESPALSPDGSRIAARIAIDGVQQMMVVPVRDQGAGMVRIGLGENDLNWWRWVNDDWLVAGIGGSVSVRGDEWYVRRAIGVNARSGKITPLLFREAAQGADDVLWIARDGTPRILLALQKSIYSNEADFWPEVVEVDVSTGKSKRVVSSRPNVLDWYADSAGTVRMGIGYDERSRTARLLYRPSEDAGFRTLDRASVRRDESLTVPALFLADPAKALAIDSSDGFAALYELDLATLTLGERLFGVDGHDISGLIADADGTGLAGVRYVDDRSRVHWIDPGLARIQKNLERAVGGQPASIESFNRDRTKMIVHVGGADRPGAYFYYDVAARQMDLFAHVNSMLEDEALAPVRTIRFRARDGLEIPAVLTLPPGREAKNLPLILMPHGGPRARDTEEWDWWVQFLADRGYAVIQPNYRGSTGFGDAFEERGEGEWGLKMQDDLNDAVAHLAAEGIADPERVCVVGASYGGYAAMRAAQRDGDKFRCAVSYAGVSDLGHLARSDNSLFRGSRRDDLREQAPDFKSVSPIHFADQFSTPILLVHGKEDRRVPVRQSREMAENLEEAGKPHQYFEQPKADHFFSREQDRLQFLQRLEAFLRQHNPAG